MENYFKAKSILFSNLVAGDFAVINNDDSYAEKFKRVIDENVDLYTYGINQDADVTAGNITFHHEGTNFKCRVRGQVYEVSMKMTGLFSVYNFLAGLTTALALKFDIKESINLLSSIAGVAGRFETIVTKPTVIVDYAHTPDGLENVLKTAKGITPIGGKLICVFGCGGDRDATKRPKMGRIAEEYADKVIVTSDNPRSENPQQIITDILAGFKSVNDVIVEPDRELAIKAAYKVANLNDVVIVAGKGHEDYQILADETIHFDDREKVREIFVGG
jgi:UDP-N-acetylmuramoyl-L-alanyl-D-glutamate--2,6-diaminopimelate ligase